MNSFVILLIGAAIWGATIGGAFIGGMVVGRGVEGDAPANSAAAAPTQSFEGPNGVSNVQPGQGAQVDQTQLQEIRQRIQSGEVTQEELQQIRQRVGGQGGQGGAGGQGRGQLNGATPTPESEEEDAESSE